MEKKVIDLEIIENIEQSGVFAISLVDVPAIEKNWMAFKKEVFVTPSGGETKDEFVSRCIGKLVGDEGYDEDQAAAICYSTWEEKHAIEPNPCWEGYEPYGLKDDGTPNCIPVKSKAEKFGKVSFDWNETLSTPRGQEIAKRLIENGDEVHIISAVPEVNDRMKEVAKELGIPENRIHATGSNTAKVELVNKEGISKHYDNSQEVIDALGEKGIKFSKMAFAETYDDYPEAAVENAKRALAWADKNGWGDCGMGAGKARANQLANRESLSRETIARMSAFQRHRQNKDTPYGEGCGGLMWDAWGGDEGIAWAERKLDQIDREEMSIDVSALPPYIDELPKKKEEFSGSVDFDAILELAKTSGFTAEQFSLNGLAFSKAGDDKIEDLKSMNFAKGYSVYKYEGSVGGDSRDFCREMMSMDKFYTYEEVAAMGSAAVNPGFGLGGASTYSIWKYKGGPNCKHRWQKYYVNEAEKFENKGAAPGIAGERPYDMDNRGYAMSKHVFASEDQRIIVGASMIPDIVIPRVDPKTKERYSVRFSKETIARIAEKFMRELRNNQTNVEHDEDNKANSYVKESWIVETEDDKANTKYGLNVPIGTWMVAMRVQDPQVWKMVKEGKLNGFSIEGNFMSKEEYEKYQKDKEIYNKVIRILKSI